MCSIGSELLNCKHVPTNMRGIPQINVSPTRQAHDVHELRNHRGPLELMCNSYVQTHQVMHDDMERNGTRQTPEATSDGIAQHT